jgi:hypothetical protein
MAARVGRTFDEACAAARRTAASRAVDVFISCLSGAKHVRLDGDQVGVGASPCIRHPRSVIGSVTKGVQMRVPLTCARDFPRGPRCEGAKSCSYIESLRHLTGLSTTQPSCRINWAARRASQESPGYRSVAGGARLEPGFLSGTTHKISFFDERFVVSS